MTLFQFPVGTNLSAQKQQYKRKSSGSSNKKKGRQTGRKIFGLCNFDYLCLHASMNSLFQEFYLKKGGGYQ